MVFLSATWMAKVNKGPGVRQGMLCAVLPEAVMVKLESCGLELEKKKKWGYVNDEASGCAEG